MAVFYPVKELPQIPVQDMELFTQQYFVLKSHSRDLLVKNRNDEIMSARKYPIHTYPYAINDHNAIHAEFIKVHDVFADTEQCIVVTEKIETPRREKIHVSLESVIRHQPLSEALAATIVKKSLEILQYCYLRNLKVFVMDHRKIFIEPLGRLRFAEPDIQHIEQPNESIDPIMPLIVSPGSITDIEEETGIQTQIWTLGIVLFMLLEGYLPHEKEPTQRACELITNGAPPRLSERFSSEARDFVAWCLIKEKEARPFPGDLMCHSFLKKATSVRDLRWVYDSTFHGKKQKIGTDWMFLCSNNGTFVDLAIKHVQ
jgi:serine/threonine protein kinase